MNNDVICRGRGQRKDNGEWIWGSVIHQTDFYGDKVDRYFIIDGTKTEDYDIGPAYEVIPETVCQYTGLDTDETTTHIYKDDIIAFDDGNVRFVGRVDKECGAWGIVADGIPLDCADACHNDNFISFFEIMWNLGDSDMILDDVVPHVRVIGNIHDNKEWQNPSEKEVEYVRVDIVQDAIRKTCEDYSVSYGEKHGGFAEKMAKLTDKLPKTSVKDKTGEWIIHTDKFAPYEKCSACGYDKPCIAGENVREIKNYCPNCGAKMEVKK